MRTICPPSRTSAAGVSGSAAICVRWFGADVSLSSLRLQLLGYAGSTQDSASKARRTSLFRALSVRTYLMKQGVRSTRMDVRALGNRVEDGSPDRVDAVVRK
jgi:hypothetical protein